MKIISWNVNGIRSVFRKGFREWLDKESPDIVCLQEIKSSKVPETGDLFPQGLEEEYFLNVNPAQKAGYSGTLVFSKKQPLVVNRSIGFERFDSEGRFLQLDFDNISLINLYIPHGARDKRNLDYKLEVYKNLISNLQERRDDKLIVCGDFNIAHKEIDLARPKGNENNIMFTPDEREQISKVIALGYVDTFRKFHKEGGSYSWWPYTKNLRERNIGWRLDCIFVSQPLESKIKASFILKDVLGSDHCPIGVELTD